MMFPLRGLWRLPLVRRPLTLVSSSAASLVTSRRFNTTASGLDAWDDIGDDDPIVEGQTEDAAAVGADRLLDRLISEVEGSDALTDALTSPRPTAAAASATHERRTRRRVALQTAERKLLDEARIARVAEALTQALDGRELTVVEAWCKLPDEVKAVVRESCGGGLRRWLRSTNLFDVSADSLHVAPLGSMLPQRKSQRPQFSLMEPSDATRSAFQEQVDGWFVELNVDGPLEPMPDPLGPDSDLNEAEVEKSIRSVQSARTSFVGEAIPPPPPPSAVLSTHHRAAMAAVARDTSRGPVGPIPVAEVVKILSPPPPPPPPPATAGLSLSSRALPGGLRTPPPLPRALGAQGSPFGTSAVAPGVWRSPAEMLDLFVDVVPTYYVSLVFLRPTPELQQILTTSRMTLPRMLKKHQFYFDVQRPPGGGPGDLPDIRLRASVVHARRGAADAHYEWAKRKEDGTLQGTPPPVPGPSMPPPPLSQRPLTPVPLEAIESLVVGGASSPSSLTMDPLPLVDAFSKAVLNLPEEAKAKDRPICMTSIDIAHAADPPLGADAVLTIAQANPDVFLFLGPNGLPPAGGVNTTTPVTLRPLSVAPGASGAYAVANSPVPKTIAALGRIVPRGIWAPIPKVLAKLDMPAKIELEDAKLSLAAVARAHGRLLYVHPDGESLRRFTGDADADDVKHFALTMIKNAVAATATVDKPDVVFSTVISLMPAGVAASLTLDGPAVVRDALKKHPKDFVLLDLVTPIVTFDDFMVGRASAFRKR